jgi:Predicted transcriptional regulators
MRQLSAIQRDLLYALVGLKQPSGQELRTELEHHYGERVANGTLYSGLKQLVNAGLVQKQPRNGSDRSFVYTVTEAGKQRVDSHIQWASQFRPDQSPHTAPTNE